MARRLAFVNEKGGTCKTTLAVHTAAWLANHGHRTLLVDVDMQGHAGKTLGIDVRELSHNVGDLLLDESLSLDEVLVTSGVEGLDLLPGNKDLADLPERMGMQDDRYERLRRVIEAAEAARGYAFVVFDAPPSMGLLTRNVMLAANEIVVPVSVTYLALDGCAEVVQTVESLRQEHGHEDLRVTHVVPTLYRRTRLAEEVMAKLADYFDGQVTPTLGFNVQIDEAQSHGQTIWEYAPWSRGAQMLDAIARTVVA
ncbi:MAG: ParA family protein [Deltaproteobacteria bacterium]|nr:ParA family protein [Deltaproteobacteria bacterium]